ncbi:recombinase family protein [Vibrio rarus]|uniref:recombinase family protein n=1 Tax=Vibrio rarus TaxID=413403 RepID=UPI0021C4BA98|nr:recombinase family protein [Vibrio rarus]
MIYAYCRVSSGKQLEGLSMSLQDDEKLLSELAHRYNTTVSKRIYRDSGKSAYKGDHLKGELGVMLNDIDTGVIKSGDIIVMRHLDRLSRLDFEQSMALFNGILSNGIDIYTTMDSRLYSSRLGNTEKAMYNALAGFAFSTANEESLRKGYYVNKNALAQIDRFQRGERSSSGHSINIGVGHHPFWHSTDGSKNSAVKFNEHYETAKQLVQYALQGNGIARCVDFLHEHGLAYTKQGVSNILSSHSLYGVLHINIAGTQHVLNDYYMPVCTRDEFNRLQFNKKSRTVSNGNRKEYSLLSGRQMLKCECGQSMNVHHSKNGSRYYTCSTQKHGLINSYVLDHLVLDALKHKVFTKKDDSKLIALQYEIECTQKQYEAKQQTAIEFSDFLDANAMATLKNELSVLKNKIIELNESIDSLAITDELPRDFVSMIGEYESWQSKVIEIINGDSDVKYEYGNHIKRLVRTITFSKDGLVKIEYKDDSLDYYYFPINSRKQTGEFYAIKLVVTNDIDILNDDLLKGLVFTLDDIKNKKYVRHIDQCKTGLKLYSKRTESASDRFANDIIDYLKVHGELLYKRSEVLKCGISISRWDKNKHTGLTKYGIVVHEGKPIRLTLKG